MRGPTSAPKIATLARLASAGLPVPEFVALPDTHEPDAATWPHIDTLLRAGPVIVRAALPGEDTAEAAGAGLGSSVAGCHDREAVRAALRHIEANLRDPWLASYFSGPPTTQVLVQREIVGPWLAVVAQAELRFVELHRRTPQLRGPASILRTPRTDDAEPLAAEPGHADAIRDLVAGEPDTSLASRADAIRDLVAGEPDTSLASRADATREPVAGEPDTPLARRDDPAMTRPPGDDIREPLAAGLTPSLAGPLALFPTELRDPITCLCDQVSAALPAASHGLDLELVADVTGAVWVVQARPLTRALHPGWADFAAVARRDLITDEDASPTLGSALPLSGLWNLDAEHNPAPLSPAHAGLIGRLTAGQPDPGMRVLAGWLYNRGRLGADPPTSSEAELRAALHALQTRHIPEARAALTRFDDILATADRSAVTTLVDRACTHLRDVLTIYAELPARPRHLEVGTGAALCLQDRAAHLDVLPASWDIASPTLNDLSPGTASTQLDAPPASWDIASPNSHDLSPGTASPQLDAPPALRNITGPTSHDLSPGTASPARHHDPTPKALATLIGELDDHLFALGLAPLRRVYLRAALLLRLSADDIFLLTPDELQAALRGEPIDLATRRREHRHHAELAPPLQLYDGSPVPSPGRGWLRGVPIGASAEGPLHLRRDLAELLADPPPPGAVLVIPALTAQAAVVLRDLGVRAVCCEHGGAMSHAALMARELGLSALIGCRGCTTIAAGTLVRLDTVTGRLRVRTA